jgi:hypothetical protein
MSGGSHHTNQMSSAKSGCPDTEREVSPIRLGSTLFDQRMLPVAPLGGPVYLPLASTNTLLELDTQDVFNFSEVILLEEDRCPICRRLRGSMSILHSSLLNLVEYNHLRVCVDDFLESPGSFPHMVKRIERHV